MITQEQLGKLEEFFEPDKVSWKPQSVSKDGTKAMAVAYVDARDVARRLDAVCGGEWSFRWEPIDDRNVKGTLEISGTVREDVGEMGEPPFGNTLKAAVSDALKRCAVQFGVARYLYYLPAQWVPYDQDHKRLKEVPQLPAWATPGGKPVTPPGAPQDEPPPEEYEDDAPQGIVDRIGAALIKYVDANKEKKSKSGQTWEMAPSTEGQRKLLVWAFQECFGSDAEQGRHAMYKHYFNKEHTQDLSLVQASALLELLIQRDEENKMHLDLEAKAAFNDVAKELLAA